MPYTGRVDNLKVTQTEKGVKITEYVQGWGGANEPAYHEHSVTIKFGSIPNLISALNEAKAQDSYDRW